MPLQWRGINSAEDFYAVGSKLRKANGQVYTIVSVDRSKNPPAVTLRNDASGDNSVVQFITDELATLSTIWMVSYIPAASTTEVTPPGRGSGSAAGGGSPAPSPPVQPRSLPRKGSDLGPALIALSIGAGVLMWYVSNKAR